MSVAEKLDAIVEEFSELEPRERLELLLEFSNNLPALPDVYEQQRLSGEHRVHECQTPVFIWVEVKDGAIDMHAWVAPEAPTVKGFVGILVDAFQGAKPDEVLTLDGSFLNRMGLSQILGMVRSRGLHAILFYVSQHVRKAIAS